MKFEEYIEENLSKYKTSRKNIWKIEDGYMLQGLANVYQLTKNNHYRDIIINLLAKHVDEKGNLLSYNKEDFNLDYMMMGKLLLFLYESENDERYKNAVFILADQLKDQPRTVWGNFSCGKEKLNQLWLESLYKFMPFYSEFETKFDKKEQYNDIITQFKIIKQYLFHNEKGLYNFLYTGKNDGENTKFHLYEMGTFLMALADTLECISEEAFEHYKAIEGMFKEALRGILPYQDEESKLFYQIVDQPALEDNRPDTSGSAMISYAIMKGCRLGALLEEKYKHRGEEIFHALEGTWSYEPKDIGVCILAYSEILKFQNYKRL